MYLKKGDHMHKSKWQLFGTALGWLFFSFIFGVIHIELFADACLWGALLFAGLAAYKFWRDYRLTQPRAPTFHAFVDQAPTQSAGIYDPNDL
jgi:hypothetical protein